MNDFHTALNEVLKYSRLRTQQEWQPFVDGFLKTIDGHEGGTGHDTYKIMADFLQDEGDPRADHLRNSSWGEIHEGLLNDGYRLRDDHHVSGEFGQIGLGVYHKRFGEAAPPKLLMHLGFTDGQWDHSSGRVRGIHRELLVTPQEAHTVVNHLPDEHKEAATAFLSRHFPQTKSTPHQS